MSRPEILKLLYGGIAVLGTYATVTRALAGDWTWALLPFAIVVFSVYRLFTMDEE